jgi:hypothetical protein
MTMCRLTCSQLEANGRTSLQRSTAASGRGGGNNISRPHTPPQNHKPGLVSRRILLLNMVMDANAPNARATVSKYESHNAVVYMLFQ